MARKKSSRKPGDLGSAKPAEAKSGARPKSGIEISPLARQALLSAARPTPVGADAGGKRKLSKQQVDAIRQFAVAMAQDDLRSDEDTVLICNRISEPPAIPLTELLYDTCRWCAADIYYDRLMPNPPDIVRVCVPCGIMLLEADKKGRN
jgi:hypothetical protein